MKVLQNSPRSRLSWRSPLRGAMVSLSAAVVLLVAPLRAQDGKTLKVCIPQHTASDAQLHQVATTLTNHKPDKATHIRIQGVQLANIDQILFTDNVFKGSQATQTLTSEVHDRAQQEHCDYLLVVSLPEIKTARSPQPNLLNDQPLATTNTNDPYMRRQDPDNYVRVKYLLYRLEPPAAPLDGFVTTHDAAPYQAVVATALDMMANQVFTKITK